MLPALRFQPILVERVWGGDTLRRFGKPVPAGKRIGESWEISDRPQAQSVVADGPHKGQTLHALIEQYGSQLLGTNAGNFKRFPLLIKLLDARERLSLQVHPPAAVATALGGEPKAELWYILDAAPDAHLIAGLRRGVTREQFERDPGSCIHRFPVNAGDAMFIPSGRVHAIDAGLVIVEIQQNSDTTYRVYDWGRPRELQIEQSLASISFNDFEPSPTPLPVSCDHFIVEKLSLDLPHSGRCDGSSLHILCCLTGWLMVGNDRLQPGEFILLPATMGDYGVMPLALGSSALKVSLPKQ